MPTSATTSDLQASRILVVEDDERLSELIVEYLRERGGYSVEAVGEGNQALEQITQSDPDLVILDIMLPGLDGMEVCRQARSKGFAGSILMLTARGEEVDEVLGLEIGADDFVAKPARPRALLARIKALLRRSASPNQGVPAATPQDGDSQIKVAGLEIHSANRVARLAGEIIDLTTAEFDLLWFLAQRAGEIVTRDQIFESVKGVEYDGIDRSIDLRVARLRRKLGDDAKRPQRIKSIRGIGYLMTRSLDEDSSAIS